MKAASGGPATHTDRQKDKTPKQRKMSKATPQHNQNIYTAKTKTKQNTKTHIGIAGAGNTRQPQVEWRVRSSRGAKSKGGLGLSRGAARVLEMENFLTTYVRVSGFIS